MPFLSQRHVRGPNACTPAAGAAVQDSRIAAAVTLASSVRRTRPTSIAGMRVDERRGCECLRSTADTCVLFLEAVAQALSVHASNEYVAVDILGSVLGQPGIFDIRRCS